MRLPCGFGTAAAGAAQRAAMKVAQVPGHRWSGHAARMARTLDGLPSAPRAGLRPARTRGADTTWGGPAFPRELRSDIVVGRLR